MKRYKFTIVGCGSSPGVPRITQDWGSCDPKNPKNRRMRPAFLAQLYNQNHEKTTIVIDTGVDFREQMLLAQVERIDAVLYTHAHADHTHGIDDLRGYSYDQKQQIPAYADKFALRRLQTSFNYCFQKAPGSSYEPILKAHEIFPYQSFVVKGEAGAVTILPLLQQHGTITSLGFRIANVAYCTDVSAFPEESLAYLKDVEILIIDCLQYKPHPSHLSLSQALDYIEKIGPKQVFFTHMHTAFDYERLRQELPEHIQPAYDGLSFFYEED